MTQDNLITKFAEIPLLPVDPIFGIDARYQKDTRKNKLNLSVGVFVGKGGAPPFILDSVKTAEKILLEKEHTKNYLPIHGDDAFIQKTKEWIFAPDSPPIYGAQTPGGTGALRVLAEFLKHAGVNDVLISDPTWANHMQIFQEADFNIERYPYKSRSFEEMIDSLKKKKNGSILLLQAKNHNPTGVDLTEKEWLCVLELCREKSFLPLFDTAYQGFGLDPDKDAYAIRLFHKENIEMCVAHSYSKSFSLYGERVGALFVRSSIDQERLARFIDLRMRTMYSNPPRHGALVVQTIFSEEKLYSMWRKELENLRLHLVQARKNLAEVFSHKLDSQVIQQIQEGSGFFALLGLSKEQVEKLTVEQGVYMPKSSRVNLAALDADSFPLLQNAVENIL